MIEREGVGYSQGDEGACRHWISRPGSHAQCLRGSSRHSKSRDQPGSSPAPLPPDHACCGRGGWGHSVSECIQFCREDIQLDFTDIFIFYLF